MRPKPEQILSELQTDPRHRAPKVGLKQGCTSLVSEPTEVRAALYPRAGLGQRPKL